MARTAQIAVATFVIFVVFLFFFYPVSAVSTYVTFVSGYPLEPQNVIEIFKAFIIALGVCVAPLAEEFMFRSFLFSGLRNRLGPAGAVVVSAAIFALYHPGPFVKIPIFMIGVILALIYWRTRSYIAVVVFHAMYNGLQLIFVTALAGTALAL